MLVMLVMLGVWDWLNHWKRGVNSCTQRLRYWPARSSCGTLDSSTETDNGRISWLPTVTSTPGPFCWDTASAGKELHLEQGGNGQISHSEGNLPQYLKLRNPQLEACQCFLLVHNQGWSSGQQWSSTYHSKSVQLTPQNVVVALPRNPKSEARAQHWSLGRAWGRLSDVTSINMTKMWPFKRHMQSTSTYDPYKSN